MKNLDNHRKEICILIKSERTTGGFTQYRLKNIFTHIAMRIFCLYVAPHQTGSTRGRMDAIAACHVRSATSQRPYSGKGGCPWRPTADWSHKLLVTTSNY